MESATTVKGADNVDIGCGNAFGGDDEAVDDSVEKVRLFPYTAVDSVDDSTTIHK